MVFYYANIEIKSEEDLWEANNDDVPLADKASKRLAVVNLDWDQINAEDLMTIFSSLSKRKCGIKKVEIYISNYGKEQIQKDSLYGPQGIWKDTTDKEINKKESEEEQSEEEQSDDGNDDPTKKVTSKAPSKVRKNQNEEFDQNALRKYELQKLKYYFAIVHCDSINTAQQIYDDYDGFEYENSALKLDLRFVPDDMKFPDPPKEVCKEFNPNHELKTQLTNSALQSSNVKLTWEAPNTKRYEFMSKNLSLDKLEELDLKDYIGSESEEEDAEKFRKLLTFESGEGRKGKAKDIEITFKSGLEEDNIEPIPESDSEKEQQRNREKVKKHKKKKQKAKENVKEQDELALLIPTKRPAEDFKPDSEDPRFASMYRDSRFIIDPSSKYYKNAGKDFKNAQIKKRKLDNS